MFGTLVHWHVHDDSWPNDVQLLLLLSDEGFTPTFKKSSLTRPSKEVAYGDKTCCHRKMEGVVEPSFISELPVPWVFDSGKYWLKYDVYRQQIYSGGSTLSEWKQQDIGNGYFGFMDERRQYKMFIKDGADQKEIWIGRRAWDDSWEPEPDWEEYLLAYYTSITDITFVRDEGLWECDTHFEYNVAEPLPWFWLDYMEEIRPYDPQDYTLINELIRTDIQKNTTVDTNSYANLAEAVDLANDIRNTKLDDLCEDAVEIKRLVVNAFGEKATRKETLRALASYGTGSTSNKAARYLTERGDFSSVNSEFRIKNLTKKSDGDFLSSLSELKRNPVYRLDDGTEILASGYEKALIKEARASDSSLTERILEDGNPTWKRLSQDAKDEVADSWLKYRYVYNTTKSDIEQEIKVLTYNYTGFQNDSRVFRASGDISHGRTYIKYRMHDDLSPNFERIAVMMNQSGFMPGLYNLWDLVPFSFVADWASNLGDYLQDIDQSVFFKYYKLDELLVSRKQTLEKDEAWGPTLYTWYDRELWWEWPQFEIHEESKTTGKVCFYRFLDTLSLVTGAG